VKNKHCAKCGAKNNLTRHHIYPQRYFPHSRRVVILCRDCHTRLERLIPKEVKALYEYEAILVRFLSAKRRLRRKLRLFVRRFERR
jgi:hypothetical protein